MVVAHFIAYNTQYLTRCLSLRLRRINVGEEEEEEEEQLIISQV